MGIFFWLLLPDDLYSMYSKGQKFEHDAACYGKSAMYLCKNKAFGVAASCTS